MLKRMTRTVQRQRRLFHQMLVQISEAFVDFSRLHIHLDLVGNDALGDICKCTRQRQQHHRGNETEDAVNICNATRIQRRVPELVVDKSRKTSDRQCNDNEQSGKYIINNMNRRHPDLLRLCADPADQERREAVTDVNADDDREHSAETYAHRARQ